MCSSKTCPKLESLDACWRANCAPSKYHQSYQEFIPEVDTEDEFLCSIYIPYPESKLSSNAMAGLGED